MAEHPDVTLVRRGYEAFSKGDLDTLREVIAADAVHSVPGNSPVSGDHKGIDAILAMYGQLFERSGGTINVELERVMTDGHGTVVGVHRSRAERNGKSIDQRESIVFTVRDGQAVELHEVMEDLEGSDAFWA